MISSLVDTTILFLSENTSSTLKLIRISGSFGQYAQFSPQVKFCLTFSPLKLVYSGFGLVKIVITDTPEDDLPLFFYFY